ncbi:MAG: hypothetical protein KC431_24870 [Myxococcales bacterium]|nr:hypothetical protein [Myxococcales bacterium]MCA9700784.1 hypothetical protein [Myxococcales bacterium]
MTAITAELQANVHASLHAVDPATLSRMSTRELDGLFAELRPADLGELQGRKRGRVLALAGIDWVPAEARGLVFGLLAELPLWQGKIFEGEFGANAWLLPSFALQFARFLVREAPALEGEGEVLRLDYDVAANPKLLRNIVCELRRLGPGQFLARLKIRWRDRPVQVLYFSLST